MSDLSTAPLRVCYFGTYRAEYERNRMMIERLRSCGVDVIECHAGLWLGFEDRHETASGGWKNPAFWGRVMRAYFSLLRQYRKVNDYDVMMLGYPGQPDVFLARILSSLRHKPLVWDVFMSIYLIARERKLEERSPILVKFLHWLEKTTLQIPDLLILDVPTYADWYKEEYGIPEDKIRLIPIGADDRVFYPDLATTREPRSEFICLYYGTYIPNHGVPFIIEAARLLEKYPDIHFKMIGTGPDRQIAQETSIRHGLKNITFIDWLDKKDLITHIRDCDVILGTFGITPQALMTMQHKIHEGLAMAKPVINGDSPAMRALLQHGQEIYLCERENPEALAAAVIYLYEHPEIRQTLSQRGFAHYQSNLRNELLSQRLSEIVRSIAVA